MAFDPSTATITFLPDGCVEYPALGIISMGETSQHDIEIIMDFLAQKHYNNRRQKNSFFHCIYFSSNCTT